MKKRTLTLSLRHDALLVKLAEQLGVSMTETVQRALEKLQESEARRKREVEDA